MTRFDRNNLGEATSPYLQQHRDNPVHWQIWGPEALAHAKAANKPVLLSVGYAACHWCHVMAHESFENAEIASVMNELFVNIKVDREERPDIDSIYMSALHMLGEQGGWPLTMFLTPDGEPFWGGTYFPPTSRWGRPGFVDVLRRVANVFRTDAETIAKNRTALLNGLRNLSGRREVKAGTPELTPAVATQLAERFLPRMDKDEGGISGAPKFPQGSILALLWGAALRTGDTRFAEPVLLALEKMSLGGIYDHLGGGYARYSTDAEWLAPHFEKMLYDNAQLLDLLSLAWTRTRNPLFAQRIRETVVWLEREMIVEGGGFASTLDADSEGEEGRFYVWREAEIDAALGLDADAFKAAYDVRPGGNWEHKTILRRTLSPPTGDAALEAKLATGRDKLLAVRAARIRPGWDDKVLADWNGLMIEALARCATRLQAPAWLTLAQRAFDFVVREMGEGARLRHAWRHGRKGPAGVLDDYACMARAALALHEATGDARYLQHAIDWVATLDTHFLSPDGGYFFTADDAEVLIVRTRHCQDNATPAGNAVMVEVLARLWLLTGEDRYRVRADGIARAFAPDLARSAFASVGLAHAAAFIAEAKQLTLIAPMDDRAAAALLTAAFTAGVPDMVVQRVAPGEAFPPGHPAAGKTMLDGRATAYLCTGPACSPPIVDADKLRAALQESE